MTTTNSEEQLKYQEVTDSKTIQKVQKRYQPSIDAFSSIGIQDIRYYQEKILPVGWVDYYPILFVAEECTFIDLSSSGGISFYTPMQDGEWCISKKHPQTTPSSGVEIPYWNTYPDELTEQKAWRFHKEHLDALRLKGIEIDRETHIDDWMTLNHQLDKINRSFVQALGCFFLLFVTYIPLFLLRWMLYEIWPNLPDWVLVIWWILWLTLPWIIAIGVSRRWQKK